MSLDLKLKNFKQIVDDEVLKYLNSIKPIVENKGLIELHRAMTYALTTGGGRIRPVLSCLVAESLEIEIKKILPFALSLELVHTYSLIHDDLPAMDNDDFRRGKPSTHKVFGESLAILAGDALNAEPYRIIAEAYSAQPTIALSLIKLLTTASNQSGMVGGQAIDIASKSEILTIADLEFLHQCKTVALFEAAVAGPALIAGAPDKVLLELKTYAQALGLLFQITDDLADQTQKEEPSVVKVLGLEKAKEYCQNIAQRAQRHSQGALRDFVDFVTKR